MTSLFNAPTFTHRFELFLSGNLDNDGGFAPDSWQKFSFSDEQGDIMDDDVCRLSRRLFAEDVRSAVFSTPQPSPSGDSDPRLRASNRRIAPVTVPVTSTFLNAELFVDVLLEVFRSASSLMMGSRPSSWPRSNGLPVAHPSSLVNFATSLALSAISVLSSSAVALFVLARLADRLVKELAMLATLNLRIIDDAEALTMCSLLDRFVMPGNGRISRLQTSDKRASSRARSPRDGASTGIRVLVVSSD